MHTGQALIDHMNKITVLPNSLALYALGQMGVAVRGPEGVVYIDACLSDIVREVAGDWWTRAYPPPITPDQMTNALCVLATHEHLDHLDPHTFKGAAAASPDARFVVTGWSLEITDGQGIARERCIVPPVLQSISLPGTSARLTAIPAAHYTLEETPDKGHRWLGYLIEWNGVTFYHGGDTIIYPGYEDTLRRLPHIDIAMLAVNGRDYNRESDAGAIGNLWGSEAARLAHAFNWTLTICGHNDLFANNAIPFAFLAEDFERTAPRAAYKFLQPGELLYFIR